MVAWFSGCVACGSWNRRERVAFWWGLEGLVSSIIGGGEGIVLGLQGYEGGCGYVYNGYQW